MQSFIGPALMVPEIITRIPKDPPGPLNGKKPGLNRAKRNNILFNFIHSINQASYTQCVEVFVIKYNTIQ